MCILHEIKIAFAVCHAIFSVYESTLQYSIDFLI